MQRSHQQDPQEPTDGTAGGAVPAPRAARASAAMRKPKDPVANRARILRAAIDEFAARGVEGASMDAIAARTDTTRSMINYYFGGKEQVYIAVLEHVYAGIRQAESQLDLEHLEPVAAIRRIVQFTFDYYLSNPGFVRLVVAENQARGQYLKKSRGMRTLNRTIIETLAAVLARGQAAGVFRAAIDPVEAHLAIAALGMFNVTNQYTFGALFQRPMGSRGDIARRRELVCELLLAWLAAPAAGTDPATPSRPRRAPAARKRQP